MRKEEIIRNAAIAIIGAAIVLVWLFGRSDGPWDVADRASNNVRQPVVQQRNTAVSISIVHSSRGTQNCSKKYGALAYSASRKELSLTANQCNENSARDIVLAACSRRARDCKTGDFWGSYCGALAYAPNGGWGLGFGANSNSAGREAIKTCKQFNPRETCQIRSTVCNS